jgi:hypothetical protein
MWAFVSLAGVSDICRLHQRTNLFCIPPALGFQ